MGDFMKICLGVIDMPYDYGDDPGATTHGVALELEDNYHVMRTFYRKHREVIMADAVQTLAEQFGNMIRYGTDVPDTVLLTDVKPAFNNFLNNKEMDGMPGVPTLASLEGVNSRMKDKKGMPGRPSFIDGGLYVANFQAWVVRDG